MTTVSLTVSSTVGFYNSTASIVGPRPFLETLVDLEGNIRQPQRFGTKVLTASTATSFLINRGNTSSFQTINLTNNGTEILTVKKLRFINDRMTPVVIYPDDWVRGSVVIQPNVTRSFSLAYQGAYVAARRSIVPEPGTYSSAVEVYSDNDAGEVYTILTSQEVTDVFNFSLTPTSFVTLSTRYSQITLHDVSINEFNGTTSSYNYNIVGSSGFSIYSTSSNLVQVQFENEKVNNLRGVYTATLNVSSGALTESTTFRHIVNVTSSRYAHYGSWVSSVSPYNCIVGMSYDLIDNVRTLTIGVGGGGDRSPSVVFNSAQFLLTENLGIKGPELVLPYTYWGTVYRIPIEANGTPKTYYSKNHLAKLQTVFYDSYFGENLAPGTLFIIDDDGFGNLSIRVNHLRTLSSNNNLNATLQNLTRVFYYYSPVDVGGRYVQLGAPKGDGSQTDLFAGFNNNGSQVTYLVPYPTA